MRTILKAALLLAAIFALWLPGYAPAADKTVGVVLSGDLPRYKEAYKAFTARLAKSGWGPDRAAVFLQTPNPDAMSWVNSVRKFVGVEADVIVTFGGAASLAAVKETSDIPVVFAFVHDPDSCGVKRANSTGVSSKVPMVTLLKSLKAVTPYSKLAVVYNPDEVDSVAQFDEARKNSAGLGFQVTGVDCKGPGEVKGKLSKAAGSVDAVYVSCSSAVDRAFPAVMDITRKANIPVVTLAADLAEQGAIITLAPSASEQGELAAEITAKLLSGAKPSSVPVEGAKKVDLVLNLKAADKLGLKVPFDVLNAATRVIK